MIATLQSKQVKFDEVWPTVLAAVRSVINMSQYGNIDVAAWQRRFFGSFE